MRLYEFTQPQKPDLTEIIKEVLPIIKQELGITDLPKIRLVNQIIDNNQPTFGRYQADSKTLEVVKQNRHPVDILRTLAHELTHYKQDSENKLDLHSGDTGSSIENQANMIAGVVMRHINKKYPNFLKLDNVGN
jgi:Zn-dependent peptidase ImmA (M78 family)